MPIQLGDIRLYSVEELSETLKLTKVSVRAYIKQRKLKGRKVGTRWYVSEESLREFFKGTESGNEGREAQGKDAGA